MQYVFNERREYIQTIEFKNTNPILNVEKINGFKEEGLVGTIVKKEFSYSFDNISWQPWQSLTSANIQGISFNDEKHFYLHVRFTRSNVAAGNIRSFYILYTSKVDSDPGFPISSSDAGTLNGEPGSYYLNLYNHHGGIPSGSLTIINTGSGIGVYDHTTFNTGIDPSLTYVYLRSILAGTGISIYENSGSLVITSDASFSAAGENIGSGDVSIYYGNNIGGDLQFRTLKAGDGIVLTLDSSIIRIDTSLGNYALKSDVDASLNVIRTTYIPSASLGNTLYWDGSVFNVNNGLYLKESSIGSGLVWNVSTGGFTYLDVSTVGGTTFTGDVSTTHVWYDTALDPSLAMPSAVGGIPAGTTVSMLNGDNITTLLNDLLFPTVQPTITAPSFSFTDNIATPQQIGNLISGTFTSTFNKGSIYNGAIFQAYRSGSTNQYTFTDPSSNTLLVDVSTSSSTNAQTLSGYLVKIGNQTFTSRVYYDEGPQPLDNKGNNAATGPLVAGNIGPSSTLFEGVYPLFATSSLITSIDAQALTSMLTATHVNVVLTTESGGNKQIFEIPTAWTGAPTNKPLLGILTYNSVSGNYEYQGGANLPSTIAADRIISLTYWTTSAVTEIVAVNVVNYTRYTYNSVDRNNINIQLEFS